METSKNADFMAQQQEFVYKHKNDFQKNLRQKK